MANSSPSTNPNSGDPTEAAKLAAAALAAPDRVRGSIVARLLAAPLDLHRCLFRGRRRRRRRRRPALPLPIHLEVAWSARIAGEMPKAFAFLEDIVQHTLSDLHMIHQSWQLRAEGTNSQKMYFMIFERGPRAFVEATCQMLTGLKSNGSPSVPFKLCI